MKLSVDKLLKDFLKCAPSSKLLIASNLVNEGNDANPSKGSEYNLTMLGDMGLIGGEQTKIATLQHKFANLWHYLGAVSIDCSSPVRRIEQYWRLHARDQVATIQALGFKFGNKTSQSMRAGSAAAHRHSHRPL